ncbi:hypothetical protein GCM10027578_30050 [Spirosoma luteolum]
MKTIQFTVDFKSFCFGALTLSALLLMANRPDHDSAQPNQSGWPNQRYQAITGKDTRTIINRYPDRPLSGRMAGPGRAHLGSNGL